MKRVVVTGMGVVSPLGNDVETFWNNAVSGVNGVGKITRFDASKFKTHFACEVKDFNPSVYLDRNEIKKTDLFTQYALYAAAEAIADSNFDSSVISPYDIGVIWGSGQGGMETLEVEIKDYVENKYQPRFNPFLIPKFIANMAPGMIAIKYGYRGMSFTTVSACASTNTAIMDAVNYIRLGKAKIMITGGSEAPITEASIGGFTSMKAMSNLNDDPESACKPYDSNRNGFVIAEGGGALILEEYEHAKKRGAKIYCEVVGSSMTTDAYHMTSPLENGEAAAYAMNLALEEAGITAADIDYLNPHATSTPVGDLCEMEAIRTVFGDQPKSMVISATKSMTGHLLGGAGAVESILCIKAIENGIIPPTINIENLDEKIPAGITIIRDQAVKKEVNYAMNNSFGFGGHNAITIFKKL
ncbi:beta-ketoacyl-ACP synthase II [Flavobacterium sp. HSC-61S13]|uniref:beta-ketoacyl-ACP synthase II n=1 Tax=Flavobacterium sp. HSC-61S13 TaxID=2910963 RepID=UPI00209DC560|nr:beta-ketoacyl-ACP synthase II [Flavobacterium sp. HSC-61S13]MCP1996591.1 3-oxoacyl-[acyl-carrier-protein] synthase II [Flavobacterium sp. HSC-61S13]